MADYDLFAELDEAKRLYDEESGVAPYRGLSREELEPYTHGLPFGKRDASERVTEAWRDNALHAYEAERLWSIVVEKK